MTGAAAASLDGSGHFALSAAARGPGEIDAATAKQLAAEFWRHASTFLEPTMSADRGTPIHSAALRPCERAYYARTPYDHIPTNAPVAIRKGAGSQWLVGLCYGDVQELVIAVSANATDADLRPHAVGRQRIGHSNFFPMGVPVGTTIPFAPELVVDETYKRLGARVVTVPVLTMRSFPNAGVTAVWEVTVERPVTLVGRTSKKQHEGPTLLVGALDGWARPALAHGMDGSVPAETEVVEGHDGNGVGNAKYSFRRRRGTYASAELVTVETR